MPKARAKPPAPFSLLGMQARIHMSWVIMALVTAWSLASSACRWCILDRWSAS
jgi:hypothetical protein